MAAYLPQCQKREKIDKRRLDQGVIFTIVYILQNRNFKRKKNEEPDLSDVDIRGKQSICFCRISL